MNVTNITYESKAVRNGGDTDGLTEFSLGFTVNGVDFAPTCMIAQTDSLTPEIRESIKRKIFVVMGLKLAEMYE